MIKIQNKHQGFTIVELLIVIVVIAILAAITVVSYNGIQQRARTTVLQADLKNASTQLEIDNTTKGSYPGSKEAANDNKGLPKSDGTTYQYTYVAANNTYCLSATSDKAPNSGYHISSSTGTIESGVCSGHSLTPGVGYAIGSTGPAGGIVFYDKGNASGGWQYLEAAPSPLPAINYEWGCYNMPIAGSGATGTAIGTGKQNTADIVASNCTPYYAGDGIAANATDAYTYGGYSDWFLPSKDELNQLYLQRGVIGGSNFGNTWTSSSIDNTKAWFQRLQGPDGNVGGDMRLNKYYYVWPIRSF